MSHETRTVNAIGARKAIRRCFNKKRPMFLWGPPGIGKSEVVAGITEELGGYMIDLRLGQMDPTDIRGIPFFNKELGKMDWAPPIDLPDELLLEAAMNAHRQDITLNEYINNALHELVDEFKQDPEGLLARADRWKEENDIA